ncbi:MAG: hypothetical protein NVS1B14_02430 [Vulcanimicrobiaceae bacterium]
MKSALLAPALFVCLAAGAAAQNDRCTREILHVRGTPVTVAFCVVGGAGGEAPLQVSESYRSPRGSFGQTSSLAFIAGDQPSRVIEDVALSQLGLSGTLHLTLVLERGKVRIEAAMLTPGAITIK